jgi:NADPH-dependent glutamate synthase beta subunit-like oxidoreductase
LEATDVSNPDYFHKVVDCQWACPAHTPVPEYIRLITAGDYTGSYLINWQSNVFPGILGRTCDRPCEPACRRRRVETQPVAICRLKRVAADYKDEIASLLPRPPERRNGKRVACVGAGPASLTVARDLAAVGYEVVVFDSDAKAGGMVRTQIPKFRLPDEVIDEEVGYALSLGGAFVANKRIESLKGLLGEGWDAVFVGCGAPRGRDLVIPGRREAGEHIHLGIDWLAGVSFGHIGAIGRRVIVLGGGNTAMDCCRTARRLGGEDVKVVVRSGFAEMKASPWEKEDALHEGVKILNFLVPKAFLHEGERLTGMAFEKVEAQYHARQRRVLLPTGEPDVILACDEVLVAVGQENAFPWIEHDFLEFGRDGMPRVDPVTFGSSHPKVFFGGDAAFGPKNIITAVAHGHEAAISIDLMRQGQDILARPPPMTTLISQKMGIHEWSYDNAITLDRRFRVSQVEVGKALRNLRTEVELGFNLDEALAESRRCLNCDVETVFNAPTCIECDACVDVCPLNCISFVPNAADEQSLRASLTPPAMNLEQAIYVSEPVKSARVMVKDEDLCLHCGLCAERCPTGAWDMQKFILDLAQAGQSCQSKR